DETGVREEAERGPRDPEGPATEAPRDDVRDLVAEDRMRVRRDLEVDLLAPRLRDVRVRGAHEALFVVLVAEEEGRDPRGAADPEPLLDGGELLLAVLEQQVGLLLARRRRIDDVAS